MKASDFDRAFDDDEDIILHLDLRSVWRPNREDGADNNIERVFMDSPIFAADDLEDKLDK